MKRLTILTLFFLIGLPALADEPVKRKDWLFALGLGLSHAPVRDVREDRPDHGRQYSCCFLIDGSLQRMVGNYFGVRAVYNFMSNTSTTEAVDNDDLPAGPPDTFQNLLTDHSGHQVGAALPFYVHKSGGYGWYIGPEAGVLRSKLVFKRVAYDNGGVGTVTRSAKEDFIRQSYYGAVIGVEWLKPTDEPRAVGWFILTGYRKYDDAKSEVETKFDDLPTVFKGAAIFYAEAGVIVGF